MGGYERDLAHQAISRALKRGVLRRPQICEVCDKACKPYAHHEDDDKPLDVVWLCSQCHANRHKQMRQELRVMIESFNVMPKAIEVAHRLVETTI